MKENIIIYEDGMNTKVWTEPDDGRDLRDTLGAFYTHCGGKITPEIFRTAIEYMSPVDACTLFNQLVNDVKLKKLYMGCVATDLYGEC